MKAMHGPELSRCGADITQGSFMAVCVEMMEENMDMIQIILRLSFMLQ